MEADCHKFKAIVSSRAFTYFVYIALLTAALVCVVILYREYEDYATFFSVSLEAVNKWDIPTATICFLSKKQMKYGTDFIIKAQNIHTPRNSAFINLTEGLNEYKYARNSVYPYQLPNYTLLLQQLTVMNENRLFERTCIKMNVQVKEDNWNGDLGVFLIAFSKPFQSKESIQEATLYLTSEKNAYGAVIGRWRDGKVHSVELWRGGYNNLGITAIKRFDYLSQLCSKETWIECFRADIESENVCQENGQTCAPVSVPSEKPDTLYPICKDRTKRMECSKLFIGKMMDNEWICSGKKKLCSLQEYMVNENEDASAKDNVSMQNIIETWFNPEFTSNMNLDTQNTNYMFYAGLKIFPTSTRGIYKNEFQKEIHVEQLSVTPFSLFGNIGGYFGLFVGFSFTGFIAWTLDIIPKGISSLLRFIKTW